MNDFYSDKSAFKVNLPSPGSHDSVPMGSQALQEIIDVLKNPFLMPCHSCFGLGYNKNGKDCLACEGTGKVMDSSF